MTTTKDHFDELSFYTLSHTDRDYFIHQLIVDAYTAQTANENTKKISIVFSLVGLYLLIEKNYTGRQIQQAHTLLSFHKEHLPDIKFPIKRGEITIVDVLANESNRDEMIKKWSESVWHSYESNHDQIKQYCDNFLFKSK